VIPPPPNAGKPEAKAAGSFSLLDVTFENEPYTAFGGYFRFPDGHDNSCVILVPVPSRLVPSFEADYGVNSVCLSGHHFRFAGRYVGVSNRRGSALRLIGELPRSTFESSASLKPALLGLLRAESRRKASNQTLEPTTGGCEVYN
jgi:hypothetical protein